MDRAAGNRPDELGFLCLTAADHYFGAGHRRDDDGVERNGFAVGGGGIA